MDQERDTTDSSRSSRQDRVRPEQRSLPEQRVQPRSVRKSGGEEPYAGVFGEIDAENRLRVDQDKDLPPTLFQLPDVRPSQTPQTKEATAKVATATDANTGDWDTGESADLSVHRAHIGPPASHVDPPSGNQSHLLPHGPDLPPEPQSENLEPRQSTVPPWHVDHPLGTHSLNDTGALEPARVAAVKEEDDRHERSALPINKWANDPRATWITRSAIVMSVLLMIVIAFLSGRGLNPNGDASKYAGSGDDELSETVVMITDDGGFFDESAISDPATDNGSIAETDTGGEAPVVANANTLSDGSAEIGDESVSSDAPSYVADAESANGTLGQPAVPMTEPDHTNPNAIAQSPVAEAPVLPGDIASSDVVAYRTDESITTDQQETLESLADEAMDSLPTGMGSRLSLENGYQYTDTPHAIGNFLEILKAWEASDAEAELARQE